MFSAKADRIVAAAIITHMVGRIKILLLDIGRQLGPTLTYSLFRRPSDNGRLLRSLFHHRFLLARCSGSGRQRRLCNLLYIIQRVHLVGQPILIDISTPQQDKYDAQIEQLPLTATGRLAAAALAASPATRCALIYHNLYCYSLFCESIHIVTGPSLTNSTAISAPKLPVATLLPKAFSTDATNASYIGREIASAAARK